jgi:DNA-binding MarR family transcriptional regulator
VATARCLLRRLMPHSTACRALSSCGSNSVVLRVEQRSHGLSVSEYSVLDVLARQDDYHLRMSQLSNAVVLSQSATTRLVSRLEARGLLQRCLCPTDRRGIYSEATKAGRDLLAEAQPTHDAVLTAALVKAAELTELAPLVEALAELAVPAKL